MPLSFSRIALYQTCPKQFEYACVKKIPRPITRAESYGSSIHNTLKKWGELEAAHQAPPKQDEQLTMFAPEVEPQPLPLLSFATLLEQWETSFIRSTYATSKDADIDYKKGRNALEQLFNWWQQKQRTVHAIEASFKFPLGNTTLNGRFDRIEQSEAGLHIIDFKTGRIKPQDYVDQNLQLSLYVLAAQHTWQLPVKSVSLLFVNEHECTEVISNRTTQDLLQAEQQLSTTYNGIKAEAFPATPSEKWCNYCPYKGVCSDSLATQ